MTVDVPAEFPCIKCGLCCRHKALVGQWDLPWDRERECCANLTEEGLCSVYEKRPPGCRISWAMGVNMSVGLTRLQAYNFQAAVCNMLLTQAGREEEIPLLGMENVPEPEEGTK